MHRLAGSGIDNDGCSWSVIGHGSRRIARV
jgi:hypothetical protein